MAQAICFQRETKSSIHTQREREREGQPPPATERDNEENAQVIEVDRERVRSDGEKALLQFLKEVEMRKCVLIAK